MNILQECKMMQCFSGKHFRGKLKKRMFIQGRFRWMFAETVWVLFWIVICQCYDYSRNLLSVLRAFKHFFDKRRPSTASCKRVIFHHNNTYNYVTMISYKKIKDLNRKILYLPYSIDLSYYLQSWSLQNLQVFKPETKVSPFSL